MLAGKIRSISPKKDSFVEVAKQVINQEVNGLKELLNNIDDVFDHVVEAIAAIQGRVIVSGMGKSGHVARKIAATLASTGTPSIYLHPAEASHGDLGMITKKDIVILLSNSGETQELAPIIDYCKRFSITIIGICRNDESTLIRASDFKVVLPSSPEASDVPAPTTSTIIMMAYGYALAVALHTKRDFTESDFRLLHPGGNIGAKLLKINDLMHSDEEMPLVKQGTIVLQAILTITSKRFGCVGVTNEKNELIGMVTDGDLRRNINLDLNAIKVEEIMTVKPIMLSPDTYASDALGIMNRKSITNLFIINEKKQPIGIIHIHDLLRAGVV